MDHKVLKYTKDSVKVLSCNPTGSSKPKLNWLNELCDNLNIDLVNIQEHFRMGKSSLNFLSNELQNFHCFTSPAVRHLPGQTRGRGEWGVTTGCQKRFENRQNSYPVTQL